MEQGADFNSGYGLMEKTMPQDVLILKLRFSADILEIEDLVCGQPIFSARNEPLWLERRPYF